MSNATITDGYPYETPVGAFRTWEDAMAAIECVDLDHTCIKYINTRDPKYVAQWTEHFAARIF